MISALVQQYIFNAPFAQYAVEFILLIVSSIYIIIRNVVVGNNLFTSKRSCQSSVVISSLVCGVTVAVINTFLNYMQYSEYTPLPIDINTVLVALITFISATVTAFITLELMYIANRKKQAELEARFDKEEDE